MIKLPLKLVGLGICLSVLWSSLTLGQQPEIDFDKARQLFQKDRRGETLTDEQQEYLDRARQLRRQQQAQSKPTFEPPADMKPLTDMAADDRYKEQDGGLYGEGRNTPPDSHLNDALEQANRIRPLDKDGKPSNDGKIVMISVGMSNTTQEFSAFVQLANRDSAKSPNVVIVDGAQGGMDAKSWSQPQQSRGGRPNPWTVLDRRLEQAGVSPQQVQVAWIKQARRNPGSIGEFPEHAEELQGHLEVIVNKLEDRFPNLRIAYLSSRIYAGYAKSALNPEPYAFESAFAVRQLIKDQIDGKASLNHGSDKGKVESPLLLWGPYLWADGENGRKMDDLVWKPEDFASDGTHPSNSGRRKVAELLLEFMKNDSTAKVWFTK